MSKFSDFLKKSPMAVGGLVAAGIAFGAVGAWLMQKPTHEAPAAANASAATSAGRVADISPEAPLSAESQAGSAAPTVQEAPSTVMAAAESRPSDPPAAHGAPAIAVAPPADSAPPAAEKGVAHVTSVNGRVMVNRAAGYMPAKAGQALQPGDRVVVLEGGSVQYVYDDGCVRKIESTSLATVEDIKVPAPCAAAEPQVAAAPASTAPVAPVSPSAGTGGAVEGGATGSSSRGWYAVGAALAIAAPVVALASSNSTQTQLSP